MTINVSNGIHFYRTTVNHGADDASSRKLCTTCKRVCFLQIGVSGNDAREGFLRI